MDYITRELVERYKNISQAEDENKGEIDYKLSLNTLERIYYIEVVINDKKTAMPIFALL
jgi:hypothetical protein